ncbi:MAG: ExeM/NucH family extracellular endonuclease [Flavobacteriales bacterium]|nr:ExeM/NucH family extracellular endonuclease [Flavobacteriales bacterium]
MIRSLVLGAPLVLFAPLHHAAAQSICEIQGAGGNSPLAGQQITTQGVVTALYTGSGSIGGYFIEDPACDTDPATSNGIFVYDTSPGSVAIGQRVQVSGQVVEFNGVTEITNASAVNIGNGFVMPTEIQLPLNSVATWERYEGMLLRFPGTLVVTRNSGWVQYGELSLAPQRNITPTDHIDPNDAVASGTTSAGASNVAAVDAAYDAQFRGTILLDDGRTASYPTPLPWVGPEGTLRTGSTITDLMGVLHYSYGDYRLEPVGPVQVEHAPRPAVPVVGGGVRAASLNVLNYFTTLGEWGASSTGELDRQRTKLIAALLALDADVLALHELENNDVAWLDLLGALNDEVGDGVYAGLEADAFGSDGSKSVIFYRTTTLTPVTALFSANGSPFQRPHITQGFAVNADGGRFLFSTVHMRSKLCDNATGPNLDQNDGQGCYNRARRDQANALVQHWSELRSSTGIEAQLIMGDFNAYAEEDPLDILRADGIERSLAGDAYSYQYQGTFGSLDHAFHTPSMGAVLTGAEVWHINSDEPSQFDYADENLGRYQPDAFRCSDHDPVLVGFNSAPLSVGVSERHASGDIWCAIGPDRSATWHVVDVRSSNAMLYVHDARGTLVHQEAVNLRGWVTVPLQGVAPGSHIWRIIEADGRRTTGRFILP